MSYGSIEYYKERIGYWHQEFNKANKRASAAIAEAKKSKERLLSSIRMMQTAKAERDQFEDMLNRIGDLYAYAETLKAFENGVYKILEERNND
ncbi:MULTISPECIES: hypothetical protein [unclassified Streptomyces]|uniref:hypothetical protein n=1 Tax=unclassified Streptomyces TaxID=2593676 RepID=UPI000A867A1B|nr:MULTISPECIES: hypothetical protein [unclassified Streptomyces]